MQAPEFLASHASHVEKVLINTLKTRRSVVTERLIDAMSYSLLAGGKRVRPGLVVECFHACGGKEIEKTMAAAMAIECIHTYSLIHDDLPCMDDDDLRRGNPTCHKKFDEATAVLAADALQALAFELLAASEIPAELRCELIRTLAVASGCQGMVGGQMLDIQSESDSSGIDILAVERIHLHKTGALLRWCCEAGALLAGANEEQFDACSRYGKAVGLLFQIADDILDVTASSDKLGKSAGKDEAQNKATYVSLLGLTRARELAGEMREIAINACEALNGNGTQLKSLANYILERDS
ncbi:farnesyl diphosphate synthase/geranylgeranyl diphosphate synthase, type II [Mariprofundus aestuarium]|uniref:Farnesyl diphosphate synthase/geranylgeranyl diphosphate synthase, type II n=1 Tax=Mariprofundus aestuarium TaxID=1921086 RepID=A0A2K8KUY7_MARES|nr:farnesyl diphosphate synthase [Mariprofundus aestuarium]ATX78503.1 farnesyl diphosphate synthase/geranylgeranyl diphosphate synthase, type II [Mariprofundus aestuarium]